MACPACTVRFGVVFCRSASEPGRTEVRHSLDGRLGATGGILGLGLAAMTMGLVERGAIAERFGRNQRFASIGGLAAAGMMGLIGDFPVH